MKNMLYLVWMFTAGVLGSALKDGSGFDNVVKAGDSEGVKNHPEVSDVVPELLYSLHHEASEMGESLGEPLTYGLDEDSWHEFIHHPSSNPEQVMVHNYLKKMYKIFGEAASVLSHKVHKREVKHLNESQILFNWFFEQFGDPTVQRFTEIMDSEQLDQATQPPPQDNADVVFVGERSYDVSHRLANPSPSKSEDYKGHKVEYEIGNVGTHLYQRKVKYSRKTERKYQASKQFKDDTVDNVKDYNIKYIPKVEKVYEELEISPNELGNGRMKDNMEDIGVQKNTDEFMKHDIDHGNREEMLKIHANIGNVIDENNLTLKKREHDSFDEIESATLVPGRSWDDAAGDEGRQFIESFPSHTSGLSLGQRRRLEANFKAALGKIKFAEQTLCKFTNCSSILGTISGNSLENMVADEAHLLTTDTTVETSTQVNLIHDSKIVSQESNEIKDSKIVPEEGNQIHNSKIVPEDNEFNESNFVPEESNEFNDSYFLPEESKEIQPIDYGNDIEMQPRETVVENVKSVQSRSPDRSRRATPASDGTSPNYGPELAGDDFNLSEDGQFEFVAYATVLSLLVICILLAYCGLAYRRHKRTRKYDPSCLNEVSNA